VYCIPNLEFDGFFSDGDHFGSELDSDGDLVFLAEAVVDELEEKAGLSDTLSCMGSTCVANNDELKHIGEGHTFPTFTIYINY
jgi:hypothetical protein